MSHRVKSRKVVAEFGFLGHRVVFAFVKQRCGCVNVVIDF